MGISKIEQEEELSRYKHAAVPVQGRRKGAGTRTWLVVSASGKSHVEEVGKHLIMKRTGLPARDLRILDPLLSYPSTILGREKAIVVNLEHIKAIITATEVLILNSIVPLVAPFVQDLQERVTNFNEAPINPSESSDTDADAIKRPVWMSPSSEGDILPIDPPIREDSQHLDVSMIESTLSLERNHGSPVSQQDDQKKGGPQVLPFEFKALEVCLESACRCLESETSKLEQEAYPALDELTSKISTLNLERVRQIKSRLVALSGRVQKVRDELEHLLDDDMDMAEMYLTNKLSSQQLGGISSPEEDNQAYYMDDERDDDLRSQTKSSSENGNNFKPDIEELEMLLEAYFVQVEGTLNKLSTMRDYVDDTEDYINIMLDDKQNQLLQMGVVLSTATLVSSAGIVVVGLFGMNINISLFDGEPVKFWETTLGTLGGCLILYFLAIGWGKTRGLLS